MTEADTCRELVVPLLQKAGIARKFGGVDALRSAVNQLQSLLYAA